MNICIVTTSYPSQSYPASGPFIKQLADHLCLHHSVRVLTPATQNLENDHNINTPSCFAEVHFYRYAPRRIQLLAHVPGGIPAVIKEKPYIVFFLPVLFLAEMLNCFKHAKKVDIFHAQWSINGVITGIVAWLTNKKSIVSLRGADIQYLKESKFKKFIVYLCLIFNRYVVCVNDQIRIQVAHIFPKYHHKIITIPNGVGEDFFKICRNYSTAKTVNITSVGSLIPRKGMNIVLEIVKNLQSLNIHLNIVGEGQEKKNLERQVYQNKISEQVTFHGALMPSEIPAHLASMDILVLASTHEGRPNAVLEAMASGMAVVASNIPGMDEIIVHNESGFLVEIGDIESFCEIIRQLVEKPALREKIGQNARNKILKLNLTWKNSVEIYSKLYKKCMGGIKKT